MKTYEINVELLTDTLLGSGESVPGTIDVDIKYDDHGIPYMEAKTFKGHVGEQMRLLAKLQDCYKDIFVDELLGSPDLEGENKNGRLFFSKLTLNEGLSDTFRMLIETDKITVDEFLNSITVTYAYTALDEEGIAKDHSLRRVRMIKKGLRFTTKIYAENLSLLEEQLLMQSVQAVQHIGTYKSKGKGLVSCWFS